MFSNSFHQI